MSPIHRSLYSPYPSRYRIALAQPRVLAMVPGSFWDRYLLCLLLSALALLSLTWISEVNAAQYEIGSEDVLRISVWGEPSLTTDVPVRPDGMISFMPLGEIVAAGKTSSELSETLTTQLAEYIKTAPQVSVTVLQFNSWKLNIIGEVNRPGKHTFASPPSLIEALSTAGSVTRNADLEHVRIISSTTGVMVREANLQRFLNGQPEILPTLKAGDTIFVPALPPQQAPTQASTADQTQQPTSSVPPSTGTQALTTPAFTINVLGHVPRIGPLSFTSEPSLVDVLTQAGGVVDSFAYRQVRVIRTTWPGDILLVDMAGYLKTGDTSLLPSLQDGDAVYVPEVVLSDKAVNTSVILVGQVLKPGEIPVAEPMEPLEVLALAGGVSPTGDPKHVRVIRETSEGLMSREINLDILGEDPVTTSFLLWPGDIVLVPEEQRFADTGAKVLSGALRILRDALFVYSTYLIVK